MAHITRDDVLKLASLSRLRLSESEVGVYQNEISEILGFVEQLKAVDLEGEEAVYQVTGLTDISRSDTENDYGENIESLLANAPAIEKNQLKVKRIL